MGEPGTERVVMITGAGGALGRGVVRAMLRVGHAVVGIDRAPIDGDSLTADIPASGDRLAGLQGDSLSPEFMESAVKETQSRFSRLDALVHLAGTYAYAPLADTDLEVWDRLVNANFTSAYVAARASLPA